MGFFHYFGNCLKRAILYQFLIFFAIFRLNKAYRFYRDFQNKLSDLISSLHLNQRILKYQPKNKEISYKIYLILLIIFPSFSILGFKFFQFFSGLLCILTGLIYHNPLRQINELLAKNEKFNIEKLQDYLPSIEFILFFSIGLAMITHSLKKDNYENKKKRYKLNIINEENDLKEQKENEKEIK